MPSNDTPISLVSRFFRSCLMLLGGILAICFALHLLAEIWGWLLLVGGITLTLWCAVTVYRYWWGRRF